MKSKLMLLVPAFVSVLGCARADETSKPLPAPAADSAPSKLATETAVLAGGCFWGMQGVFQHVKGVTQVVSGFSGGAKPGGGYEEVSSGTTGNAESIRITFDPKQVSFGQILRVYFSVMDPTTLNYQGPDEGTQYRSVVFYKTGAERQTIRAALRRAERVRLGCVVDFVSAWCCMGVPSPYFVSKYSN